MGINDEFDVVLQYLPFEEFLKESWSPIGCSYPKKSMRKKSFMARITMARWFISGAEWKSYFTNDIVFIKTTRLTSKI